MEQKQQSPVLWIALIIAAFAVGTLWTKVTYLEKGGTTATSGTTKITGAQPTGGAEPTKAAGPSLAQIKALFTKDNIAFGDSNKKVLFVEISDPSCPFCHFAGGKNPELSKTSGNFQYVTDGGTYNPPVTEMKKLVDSGKASFVWLYANGHGNGITAAQALYCANEKGKFWDANDLLMSNVGYELMNTKMEKGAGSGALDNDANRTLVVNLLANVVDPTFLKTCLTSGKYAKTLDTDQQTAQTLGFQGTPDFFVNEKNYGGAVDYKTAMEPQVTALLK